MKSFIKILILLIFLLTAFSLSTKLTNYRADFFDDTIVSNNIRTIKEEKLLLVATKMNAPGWNDILIEVLEWTAFAGITYITIGSVTPIASVIKLARTTDKAYKITKSIKKTKGLLNKVVAPIYKLVARKFNQKAIARMSKRSGIYLFFDKNSGDIKYIGKAKNLKKRLGQHFRGDITGNKLLHENKETLAFVTLPLKARGNVDGANKCVESILINVFNNSANLYNKQIPKINPEDCLQFIKK
jgi:hypothetical protein